MGSINDTTPRSGISDKKVGADPKVSLVTLTVPGSSAPTPFPTQNPDTKLLEAMRSPKDRLFLLRLEQQLNEFVLDSKYIFPQLTTSLSITYLMPTTLGSHPWTCRRVTGC